MQLLSANELAEIEKEFPIGLSVGAIVEIFRPRGVALTAATFRKYVQAGLLPRSRRVGRKGKHKGSQGLYPVEAVRRINLIKKLMAEGQTLEEIKRSPTFLKGNLTELEVGFDEVLNGLSAELGEGELKEEKERQLQGELDDLRQRAQDLLRDFSRMGSVVSALKRNPGQHSLQGIQAGAGAPV